MLIDSGSNTQGPSTFYADPATKHSSCYTDVGVNRTWMCGKNHQNALDASAAVDSHLSKHRTFPIPGS